MKVSIDIMDDRRFLSLWVLPDVPEIQRSPRPRYPQIR